MKPADQLGAVFGLERSAGSLSRGYIKTDPGSPLSNGIVADSLQIHDVANLYSLVGAKPIAWLYADRDTATKNPAITVNTIGKGQAVAFAFDLAKSISYMRQGNPESANQEMDGMSGVRTVDMFVDWIDLDRIQIPHADEQQRLFVSILAYLSSRPLPRLWYFPEDNKSVLIATGDSHTGT